MKTTKLSVLANRRRTFVQRNGQPLRVLQLTDTHLFSNATQSLLGINTLASLRRVVALAQQSPCDLVLATGDLVHAPGKDSYQALIDEVSLLDRPVFCLPGNHDERLVMSKYLNCDGFHTKPLVESDAWQILMLDSTIPGNDGGRLDVNELAFLDKQLTEDPRHALVCLHHHPLPLHSEWIDSMVLEDSQAFFDIIDAHDNVRGIVFGHVHQEYDRMRGAVRLLATPSTCVQFAPRSKAFRVDKQPPGFRILELAQDGRIETQVTRCEDVPAGLEVASAGY